MQYVNIGKFAGTHGLKGEIKLKTDFEYIDKVLCDDFSFYVGEEKTKTLLNSFRYHNGYYLLSFKSLLDIDLVHPFVNKFVYVIKDDLCLSDSEYTFDDYIGCLCYSSSLEFGTVSNVVDCGNGNYVFQVIGDKEILIPLNEHFIDKIGVNKIYFKNLEGFIDEN